MLVIFVAIFGCMGMVFSGVGQRLFNVSTKFSPEIVTNTPFTLLHNWGYTLSIVQRVDLVGRNDEWLQVDTRTNIDSSQEKCQSTKQQETRCWERTVHVPEGMQPVDIMLDKWV